jgi:predicted Zn-dependent protease with MMP-like domain
MGLSPAERERFDALMEEAVGSLPDGVRGLLDEVPVIVDDEPGGVLLGELARAWGEEDTAAFRDELREELCGLHSGVAITERSVEHGVELPEEIRVFRRGVIAQAGGWAMDGEEERVYEEIWVTLLHEIGHHFGLDEDDLEGLGFG